MEINLELPLGRDERLNDDNNGENVVESGFERVGDVMNLNDFNDRKTLPNCYMPQNSLEFETKEAAYSFYREYARSVGFGITIKASRRSKKTGKFIDIKIVCSRFGSRSQSSTIVSPRSCPKTNCKASMHIKRKLNEKWFIHSFVEDHNHEICPDQFHNAVRGKNKQNANAVSQKRGLQLVLNERDVQILLDYFMLMQADAPGFYYIIDFDEEARMRNVFWVNFKGRYDYVPFCDVVFFDTYYIRNGFKIPFVPIVGVNHHFQFILLGCALIGDETLSTYVWLMRTWLRAVGDQLPKVVITDNDKLLIEATAEVFPDASHFFCPWHVFNELGANLSHKLTGFEDFLREFEKCTYRSSTEEEFEKKWKKMVNKYDLTNDEWIQSLYEVRRKWIPTYMKDIFLGGFCTVERSQSVVSLFDKYFLKENMIEEFINQYKLFLHEIYEQEADAENESQHTKTILLSHSPFEKQVSKVYTHAIYTKLQAEVLGIVTCNVGKVGEDETTITFEVDDLEKKQTFIVSCDKRKCNICCLCRLFEYNGYLCRHALSVFQLSGISTIPLKYILKRWTRKAKTGETICRTPNNLEFRVHRLNDICKLAIKLGEQGSLSGEAYQVACQALEEALKHCVGINYSVKSVLENNMTKSQGLSDRNMVKGSKTKKVLKKRKVQAAVVIASTVIKESTQDVEQLNTRSLNLDNSYIYQQDLERMELDSRIPIINGYYGTQGQRLEPLNSLSSPRDSYYRDQSSMQGLSGNLGAISTRASNHSPQQSLQGMLQGQFSFKSSALEHNLHKRDG